MRGYDLMNIKSPLDMYDYNILNNPLQTGNLANGKTHTVGSGWYISWKRKTIFFRLWKFFDESWEEGVLCDLFADFFYISSHCNLLKSDIMVS